MYKNVDEVLRDIYRFGALRIEPLNNTAQVCQWIENKGVSGSKSSLTQAEWHANAAMIQSRIERVLNRFELAVVECEYGAVDLHNIVDLTVFIEQENKGVNLLICDDLLMNLFTGAPRLMRIQDKYNLHRNTVSNHKRKINRIINSLLNSAICKLELEFQQKKIIEFVA